MSEILQLMYAITPMRLLISLIMIVCFVIILFLGSKFLPGFKGKGEPLQNGTRKEYKLTGFLLFMIATFSAIIMLLFNSRIKVNWRLSAVAMHFWSLLVIANIFAVLWSLTLFIVGRRRQGNQRRKGLKGILHDLWFGAELNPTFWGIDLKMFAYHPSLIGLSVINWSFLFLQLETLGRILPQMWMYQGFWWFYLFTHYILEEFMLSTWDIMSENFGFMLVWGDSVYVPFFYSIGGWFIVTQTTDFNIAAIIILSLLFFVAIWIFRGSNIQKYRFKKNPKVKIWRKTAKTLEGKLLISGFWRIGRKLNYTGEILTYLIMTTTTGLTSWIPYVLPLSLFFLLSHRAWRDDKRCKRKYGKLWDEYCKIAKFKIIPFIY